jgi:hypothetical protein
MKRLPVTLELQGRHFTFDLCRRTLQLGPAGPVSYYWMDSAALRRSPPGPNFRACVDFWWAAMEHIGADGEIDTRVNRVWAECYPLVNNARSLQDVYIDAHLERRAAKRFADPRCADRADSLPADEVARLRAVAGSRSVPHIRAELDVLFLGVVPTPDELPASQEAARAWIGQGLVALQTGGLDALSAHVATLGTWIGRYRKRGGEDRARRFLNWFAYESKVAFYLCYANAWIGLIPRLRDLGLVEPFGERLLRLWHHQNQPGDDPDGTGRHRDAFAGQVLALHPLSAFVMNDPAHLQALGAWIDHPEHDRLVQQAQVGAAPAYWDLVAALLIAAHEYKLVRDHWDQTRTSRTLAGSGDRAADAIRDESPPPLATELEDYAAARAIHCPACAGAARFVRNQAPAHEAEAVRIDFECATCGHPFDAIITVTDFEAWLMPDDD